MAARAAELGMPALGLTDHGVMNGAVEHYKACASTASSRSSASRPTSSTTARAEGRVERNHLTLLAVERHRLPQPGQAHLGGLPRGLRARQGERRHGAARALLRGRDRAHRLPAVALLPPADRGAPGRRPRPPRRPRQALRRRTTSTSRSRRTASPSRTRPTRASPASRASSAARWSATADVHYLRREDYDNHAALLCVQTKSTLEQPKMTLRHQRVLPQDQRGDGGVVRAVARAGADDARDRRALQRRDRARQAPAAAVPDARRRGARRDAAAAARRGPAPPLRRPDSRPRPASAPSSSSA